MADPDHMNRKISRNTRDDKALVRKIKKRKPADLDQTVRDLHATVFSHTDCLECANCCKTISPMLIDADIRRISSVLRMRPAAFTETYLMTDEDGDFVFRETPCPFLMPDNYCMIYEHRPRACREYPHTNRKRFRQILNLTMKNAAVCPAVSEIVETLRERYKN